METLIRFDGTTAKLIKDFDNKDIVQHSNGHYYAIFQLYKNNVMFNVVAKLCNNIWIECENDEILSLLEG